MPLQLVKQEALEESVVEDNQLVLVFFIQLSKFWIIHKCVKFSVSNKVLLEKHLAFKDLVMLAIGLQNSLFKLEQNLLGLLNGMVVFLIRLVSIQMSYLNIKKEINTKQLKDIRDQKHILMTLQFINQLISSFQQLFKKLSIKIMHINSKLNLLLKLLMAQQLWKEKKY